MTTEGAVVVVAALLAPLATYLVARRQRSGRVITTEAAQLWTESTQMRKELRDHVARLEERVSEQEIRIKELERERALCLERLGTLEAELAAIRRRTP